MVTESRGKPKVKKAKKAEVVAVDPGGDDSDRDPVPVAPAIAVAPVPIAPAIAVAPVEVGGGSFCNCKSEVHRLTDEMYKLGGVNKDLINENQLLKNKVHFLEQDVKNLHVKLKNKEVSLKLMNPNGYRLIDRSSDFPKKR